MHLLLPAGRGGPARPSAPRPASGRLRYIGLVLYDADRVLEAASTPDEHDLYEAQRSVLLDPNDPEVVRAAERDGIPHDWVVAAQRSPIHALINRFKVALPLHPEYRTMPMVWYVPPLSPVVDVVRDTGEDAEDAGNLFAAIDALRIPIEYLAELFTAGDVAPVDRVLRKLAAMRSYMRDINLGREPDPSIPERVGMSEEEMYDMYRLLALAKYDERYVIPPAHAEQAHALEELATECALDYEGGPGHGRLRARSARGPGPRHRLPSRTSPCSATGRQSDTMAARATSRRGSTSSTGTARASPRGCSRRARRAGRDRGGRPMTARHPRPERSQHQLRAAWQAASLLLAYPDDRLQADLPTVRAAAARLPDRPGHAAAGGRPTTWPPAPLEALQPAYVETFDNRRRCSLYLTYFAHGDTRKRGVALLRFKQTYLRSGSCSTDDRAPRPPLRGPRVRRHRRPAISGWRLLLDHRAGLELLRLALEAATARGRTPSRAVCATLPPLRGDEREAIRRLAAEGPPAEEVGLSPYGAPGLRRAPEEARGPRPRPARAHAARSRLMSTFLWVVVPYICLTVFAVGHFWRYRYDKFGWTTRSSQLYEDRLLRLGSPLFHFGMLGVVGGHVIGLLVPESWTHAVGHQRRDLPPGGGRRRARRRRDGAGRPGDPGLPAAHGRPGLLRNHPHGQGHVRLPRRRHRARLLEHRGGVDPQPRRRVRLPGGRLGLVPLVPGLPARSPR